MSIFEYPFMQRAFLVGILLALIIPCVGIVIVLKRLSMIGDALSHTSLAGVAAGLLFNINPVLGATAACVAAAFGIEAIRKKLPRYAEMSIAIILSAGVGLAGVLSGFVRSAASFNSFLFGSIVAISDGELYTVAVVSGIIVLAFLFLYKELFYLALDERAARMSGIPVGNHKQCVHRADRCHSVNCRPDGRGPDCLFHDGGTGGLRDAAGPEL